MPEVTFYILPSQSQQERQTFACKLIEKIWRSGEFCFVLTDSEQQSKLIDDSLWTFRPGSFVPHQAYINKVPDIVQTILIGHTNIPADWQKIIVNLSSGLPEITDKCERVLEILDNSEETKQAGRLRYRHYTQAGITIKTHKI
jgi:DNA polymerase III subunit chi